MNIPLVPLINGKSYEWANIVVNIMGVPIVGITNIEYEEKYEMENIYGAGSEVVSRGYGKNTPTAKMTILMEELEAIQKVAPLGKLQRIPEFDIVVAYLDTSLAIVTHKIRNVRIMNNSRKSNTGDTSIPVELELLISNIEWSF
jgi:hypothetical protein